MLSQLNFLEQNDAADAPQLVVPDEQRARLQAGEGDYLAEFISSERERELLAQVDGAPWITTLRRRVQHYGYRYDYTRRHLSSDDRIGDLPSWVMPIVQRLTERGIFDKPPEQMIVNEYEPGQGIAPHSDSECFGETLASLSLGSACMMRVFPHPQASEGAFDIVLEPRSLVIYRGKSRHVWRHAILSRKSDEQAGRKIPRSRRVSLTFRIIS